MPYAFLYSVISRYTAVPYMSSGTGKMYGSYLFTQLPSRAVELLCKNTGNDFAGLLKHIVVDHSCSVPRRYANKPEILHFLVLLQSSHL